MLVVLSAVLGALVGLWAMVFLAANRAHNVRGNVAAAILAVAPVVYYFLPDAVTPKPGAFARSTGLVSGPLDGVWMALVVIVVAVGVAWSAQRFGLTGRISAAFDRKRRTSE
ncbi:MAG: hypothetical protein LBE08_08655 [Bifidobacteriaceae bacterium]|nr:hypothetical protein [Bifidobacteriaceae bacterium]